MQDPLEEQTVVLVLLMLKQIGIEQFTPVQSCLQIHVSAAVQLPFPEHTDKLLYKIEKQIGFWQYFPVQPSLQTHCSFKVQLPFKFFIFF
jgi:hypothetical protein